MSLLSNPIFCYTVPLQRRCILLSSKYCNIRSDLLDSARYCMPVQSQLSFNQYRIKFVTTLVHGSMMTALHIAEYHLSFLMYSTSTVQYNTSTSTVQYQYQYSTSTVPAQYQYSTSTVQYSTLQYSKVQYHTVQYQYSTSTVQYQYSTSTAPVQCQYNRYMTFFTAILSRDRGWTDECRQLR